MYECLHCNETNKFYNYVCLFMNVLEQICFTRNVWGIHELFDNLFLKYQIVKYFITIKDDVKYLQTKSYVILR